MSRYPLLVVGRSNLVEDMLGEFLGNSRLVVVLGIVVEGDRFLGLVAELVALALAFGELVVVFLGSLVALVFSVLGLHFVLGLRFVLLGLA